MNKISFVFFGTGDFAVKILEILCQNGFVPEIIVTAPDKPKSRKMILTPSPVKIFADKNNIKFIQPEKLDSHQLSAVSHRLFIVADYGKIIPKEILDIPKHGSLNVHPSLLPKFRGPSPVQSFILSGENETGATIILMDEKMDHGPILAQQKLEVKNIYHKELKEKMAELGGNLLVEILPKWLEEKIKPQEQKHNEATFTKKITKQDGSLDLNEPPEIIERKIRAFTPWPGAYFFADKKRIIITKAETKDGKLIIKTVKPEGKREINFEDFLKGNKSTKLERYQETA